VPGRPLEVVAPGYPAGRTGEEAEDGQGGGRGGRGVG